MKKILLSIVFVCLSATMIHAQNLVTNGNFETWTTTTTFPDNWAASSSSHWGLYYYYITDATQGNVLRLTDSGTGVAARRFNTTVDFSISTEGTYRVIFKVKGNVGLRGVILVKGTANPSTTTASATNHIATISDYPSGTNVAEWTTLQYDIIVPSTATFGTDYRLHFSWSSSATLKPTCDFMIDDITLQKVDVSTALNSNKLNENIPYIKNGKIEILSNKTIPCLVYSLNGTKLFEGTSQNVNTFALKKGVYIVKMQDKSIKILL